VELLAVLAIVGVLCSLLLPALAFGKFQAKNTACRSNLRQMGLALQLYLSTFDAYPPYAIPALPAPAADTYFRWDMLLTRLAAPTREVLPFSSKGARPPARTFLCPLLIGPAQNLFNPFGPAWDSAYRYNSMGVAPFFGPLGVGGVELDFPRFAPARETSIVAPSEGIHGLSKPSQPLQSAFRGWPYRDRGCATAFHRER
jgi:type II secretory pathway pseudopilin PulG